MDLVQPVLQTAINVARAFIRDVELSVLGTVPSEGNAVENVPPKKQQLQTCISICSKWGDFPCGDPIIEQTIANWSLLPLQLRLAGIAYLVRKEYEELGLFDEGKGPNELLQTVVESVVAQWIHRSLKDVKIDDTDLLTAIGERTVSQPQQLILQSNPSIMVKLLTKRLDSSTSSISWWWSAVVSKLKNSAYMKWTEILSNLAPDRTDEFISNHLAPLATTTGANSSGAAVLSWCTFDLVPRDANDPRLPLLMMQAYSNTEDEAIRESILDSLQRILERADLLASTDATRLASKVLVVCESAIKSSKDVKDSALRVIATVLPKIMGDQFDAFNEKFFSKRIIRSLSGTDVRKFTRALELALIVLQNCTNLMMRRKCAQQLSAEVFEKPKSIKSLKTGPISPVDDSNFVQLAYLIVKLDPITGINRTLPALLSDEDAVASRKFVIGASAVKLLLMSVSTNTEILEKLVEVVHKWVIPCLETMSVSSSSLLSYDWTAYHRENTQVSGRKAVTTSAQFFGNLMQSSFPSSDLRARMWLRKTRLEQEKELERIECLLQQFFPSSPINGTDVDLDGSTVTRIMAILQSLDCLLWIRKRLFTAGSLEDSLGHKSRNLTMIPPIQLLDRVAHHPAVCECTLEVFKQIARQSDDDFSIVVSRIRNHVIETMKQVAELVQCCTLATTVSTTSQGSTLGAVDDVLVHNLTALALALITAEVPGGEDLLEVVEAFPISSSHLKVDQAALSQLRRSNNDIVSVASKMSVEVKTELIRILVRWQQQLKPMGNYNNNQVISPLNTTACAVIIACDSTRADLETLCWNASLRRQAETAPLLEVVAAAKVHELSTVDVLRRIIQWWRAHVQVSPMFGATSASTSLTATSSSSQPKKSFSVLRRLTAGQQQQQQGFLAGSTNNPSTLLNGVGSPSMTSSYASYNERAAMTNATSVSTASVTAVAPLGGGGSPSLSVFSPSMTTAANVKELNQNTTEEDEILIRVVWKVIEGGEALKQSLCFPQAVGKGVQTSLVLRYVREVLGLFTSSSATPGTPGTTSLRKRMISYRFAMDLCDLLATACDVLHEWLTGSSTSSSAVDTSSSSYSQWCKQVDDLWARAERRKTWIFLRKLSGFYDVPMPVFKLPSLSTSFDPQRVLDAKIVRASAALLRLGPVSLGSIADAPDKELWQWILKEKSIADHYLVAHFGSLFPCYFSQAFPSVSSVSRSNKPSDVLPVSSSFAQNQHLLVQSIVNGLKFHFTIDIVACTPAQAVMEDKLARAMLVVAALLIPRSLWAELGDEILNLLCVASCTSESEALGYLREVKVVNAALHKHDFAQKQAKLSSIFAKVCPELAFEVVDLLWERNAFAYSEPWITHIETNAAARMLLDKAWTMKVPSQVWKSFTDETTVISFLLEITSDPLALDAVEDVVRNASSKSILRAFVPLCLQTGWGVLLTNIDGLDVNRWKRLSMILGERLPDVLNASDRSTFIDLVLLTVVSGDVVLVGQMDRWILEEQRKTFHAKQLQLSGSNTGSPSSASLSSKETVSSIDELVVFLVEHKPSESQELLDAIVSNMGRFTSFDSVIRLYCQLRSHAVLQVTDVASELDALLRSFPLQAQTSLTCLLTLVTRMSEDKHSLLPQHVIKPFGQLLSVLIAYIAELYLASIETTSGGAAQSLVYLPELVLLKMLSLWPSLEGFANGDVDAATSKLFWTGFEHLVRVEVVANHCSLRDAKQSNCYKILALFAASSSKAFAQSLRLFEHDQMTLKIGSNVTTTTANDCGQDALLLLFDACTKLGSMESNNNEQWLCSLLECPFAGQRVALKAMKELILSPKWPCKPVLACLATRLVARVLSEPESEMVLDSSKPVKSKYVGPVPEDIAIQSAQRVWRDLVTAATTTTAANVSFAKEQDVSANSPIKSPSKSKSFVTDRKRDKQFIDEDSIRLPSLPVPAVSVNNRNASMLSTLDHLPEATSPAKKKTRKPILDIRDALQDPYARTRLFAHAADKGYDTFLLQKLEHVNYVEGLDKEEIWHSFQRSRWWIFEDDMSAERANN